MQKKSKTLFLNQKINVLENNQKELTEYNNNQFKKNFKETILSKFFYYLVFLKDLFSIFIRTLAIHSYIISLAGLYFSGLTSVFLIYIIFFIFYIRLHYLMLVICFFLYFLLYQKK